MTSVTYLELAEGGAGAHKFYEIARDDTPVTIHFGRIGTTHVVLHRLLNESFQARLWGAAYIINGGCSAGISL